jgi:nucleoside-diphosphate-sugar epimerase
MLAGRSFCYVDDMTGAFIRLMRFNDDPGSSVNLSNPHARYIRARALSGPRHQRFARNDVRQRLTAFVLGQESAPCLG